MRTATTLAAIVGLLTVAQAGVVPATEVQPTDGPSLHVPEGTPDGVYNIYLDASGEVVLEKVADLVDPPVGEDVTTRNVSQNLEARAITGKYTCAPVTLVSNDIQRAAYNLGQTCDTNVQIQPRKAQTAISGSVVVYACNDARYTTHYCRSSTINGVVAYLEEYCPSYRAGEFIFNQNQAPNGNGVRTYGYTAKGNGICYGLT